MGHGHSHHQDDHHHHHAITNDNARRITWVLSLTAIFMFVEFIYGYLTNSLALIADATHMFTDVAALALTLIAFKLSTRPATDEKTFGYYRMEILAAFINGIVLAILSIGIIWHAWERIQAPPHVDAPQMVWVAVIGLVINLLSGYILTRGHSDNLNMRGALLHVMGDALASVGTIIASLFIIWKDLYVADPIVSIIISGIIIFSAYRLITDTIHVILQGAPKTLDTKEIRNSIMGLEGVVDIHSLHVWSLSSNLVILSVHIVETSPTSKDLLHRTKILLKEKFRIDHTTIQLEPKSFHEHERKI